MASRMGLGSRLSWTMQKTLIIVGVVVLLIGLGFGEPLPPMATYPGLVLIVGATVILQRARTA